MANKFYDANVWIFEEYTGGTEECLDFLSGEDVKDGDVAFVNKDGEFRDFILVSTSGKTHNPPWVIEPSGNPGDKRWELQKVPISHPIWLSFVGWESGLNNRVIYSFDLQTNEKLQLYRFELPMDGGGTNSNFIVDLYDNDSGTLTSLTAGDVNKGNPIVESNIGNRVDIRVTNNTGENKNVAIKMDIAIVEV